MLLIVFKIHWIVLGTLRGKKGTRKVIWIHLYDGPPALIWSFKQFSIQFLIYNAYYDALLEMYGWRMVHDSMIDEQYYARNSKYSLVFMMNALVSLNMKSNSELGSVGNRITSTMTITKRSGKYRDRTLVNKINEI